MFAKSIVSIMILTVTVVSFASIAAPVSTYAKAKSKTPAKSAPASPPAADVCGSGDSKTKLAINIGCQGKGNAIADALFAIIRVLSEGVGLVVVGSIVWAGIQYSTSQGNPQATASAVNRIRASIFALLLYIFGFWLLNYLIPGHFLQ